MEAAWHASLLLIIMPPVLRGLLRSSWPRVILALAIVAALAYHVAVVEACHQGQALCYWGRF